MNRLRVVLDTNVYVSGIQFGGIPAEILAQATEGVFILCVSEAIRDELTDILRTKFQRGEEQILQSCNPLWEVAHHVTPERRLLIADDPDDNRILECAATAEADVIVSGDDDILRLRNSPQPPPIDKLRFMTPREFLGSLAS